MMHKWEFEDGTVVRWTSKGSMLVHGDSDFADHIRGRIERASSWHGTYVAVHFEAGCLVKVDMSSIWLVDRLMRNEAMNRFVKITSSTYTPRDEDMPPEAAEKVYRSRNWPPLPEGAVS